MCSPCSLVVVYFVNTADCQENSVKKIMYNLGEREEGRGESGLRLNQCIIDGGSLIAHRASHDSCCSLHRAEGS